ncbi:MAG: hypothetical protein ACO23H_12030 [Alphaproteobacteria bacterium]
MNKHIELVKKWLTDPESVTEEELQANSDAARAAARAADAWADKAGVYDAAWAADSDKYATACNAAAWATIWAVVAAEATIWAADDAAEIAADWVRKYEELTGEYCGMEHVASTSPKIDWRARATMSSEIIEKQTAYIKHLEQSLETQNKTIQFLHEEIKR